MHEQDSVCLAVINRICDLLVVEVNPREVDITHSLLASEGFTFGDYAFDSLDVANVLVALEADLGVPLLEGSEQQSVVTLQGLTHSLLERAQHGRLEAFVKKWS